MMGEIGFASQNCSATRGDNYVASVHGGDFTFAELSEDFEWVACHMGYDVKVMGALGPEEGDLQGRAILSRRVH